MISEVNSAVLDAFDYVLDYLENRLSVTREDEEEYGFSDRFDVRDWVRISLTQKIENLRDEYCQLKDLTDKDG